MDKTINVKLAIRVRSFTEKELKSDKDRIQVVHVLDERTVTITNMKVSVSGAGDSRTRVRLYNADFTFDNACEHSQRTHSSQEKIFNAVGRQVLGSFCQGSSACVLAYGQSATGKTHTMMGTESQPGLIPRVCRALAEEHLCDLSVSFLEIYNERVHDLLAGEATVACQSLPRRGGNARKDLRVRHHPTRGPYVQNLRRVAVHGEDSLLSVVAEGARRRRTAATRRNSTSSRSHALLELATPHATLLLADLAGSEKASWEGCGGGRQKEGANINKSLVALSNVISALVSGGRGRYVPYRDSALTWLLKDCFTGGALTFIIATVSPSISCYGESASTLRWAERVRQVPIPRMRNSSNVPSRAALQTQLNQLLAELTKHYIKYIPATGEIKYDDCHWTLINKESINILRESHTGIKIGNIMSISRPKTDAHNSESTTSSVASGSSDVINIIEKNTDFSDEISKEVDKLFGPTLERTRSGGDLKIEAPEKSTIRHYKSQELPVDKTLQSGNSSHLSDVIQSLSEVNIDEAQSNDDDKICPVPIVYDNNYRADIVASVTDRLYTKLKKKDMSIPKVDSPIEKKVTQPINELRICTNARQRLVELSQKALRNKRRIGIPVHTQTRRTVIRVKDQEVEAQYDLESYSFNKKRSFVVYRDASTETIPIIPRYKDIGVGPTFGSLHLLDKTTNTENKKISRINSIMMTDTAKKVDFSTQTPILQPVRRKKRSTIFSRLLKKIENSRNVIDESHGSPVININISPSRQEESESSEDNRDNNRLIKNNVNTGKPTLTPDLLTHHSSCNKQDKKEKQESSNCLQTNLDDTDESILLLDDREACHMASRLNDEFPEAEDNILPRVIASPSNKGGPLEIKDLILGRSVNSYPYNIVVSPTKPKNESRKIIRFKEIDITPAECCNIKLSNDVDDIKNDWITYKESRESIYSDCSSSSKLESDTFSWRKSRSINKSTNTSSSLRQKYLAVPKSNIKYKIARAKLYKEFLGLERDLQSEKKHHDCSPPKFVFTSTDFPEDYIKGSQDTFRKRRQYFENKFSRGYYPQCDSFRDIEQKIVNSCKKLELSADRYEHYLNDYKENKLSADRKQMRTRTPTEYLQHLVQLRKEMIQANSHRNESFV